MPGIILRLIDELDPVGDHQARKSAVVKQHIGTLSQYIIGEAALFAIEKNCLQGGDIVHFNEIVRRSSDPEGGQIF